MILGTNKWGDPWHGLMVGAAGLTTSPGGKTFTLPGVVPADGSSYLLKMPGLPAPENTAADVAAGRTWLNYAILSGDAKRLYGKELGKMSWIYIAPDKTPWLATLTASASRSPAVCTMSLALKRFGLFGLPDQTVKSQTIDLGSTALSLSYSMTGIGLSVSIDDVNANGSSVLLALGGLNSDYRVLSQLLKITIEGQPAGSTAATATVTTLANEAQIHAAHTYTQTDTYTGTVVYWYSISGETYPLTGGATKYPTNFVTAAWTGTGPGLAYGTVASPPDMTSWDYKFQQMFILSHSVSWVRNVIIGARFGSDGETVEIIRERLEWSRKVTEGSLTAGVSEGVRTFAYAGLYECDSKFSIVANNDVVGTAVCRVSAPWSVTHTSTDSPLATWMVDGTIICSDTAPIWNGTDSTMLDGASKDSTNTTVITPITIYNWENTFRVIVTAYRATNAVYSIKMITEMNSGTSNLVKTDLGFGSQLNALAVGKFGASYTQTNLAEYATEHPVSGAISRGSTLRCYV